jgi:hypothetical protein
MRLDLTWPWCAGSIFSLPFFSLGALAVRPAGLLGRQDVGGDQGWGQQALLCAG